MQLVRCSLLLNQWEIGLLVSNWPLCSQNQFCPSFYVSCWVYVSFQFHVHFFHFVELLVKCLLQFLLPMAIPIIISVEGLGATVFDISGGGLCHFILFVVVIPTCILLCCDHPVFVGISVGGGRKNVGTVIGVAILGSNALCISSLWNEHRVVSPDFVLAQAASFLLHMSFGFIPEEVLENFSSSYDFLCTVKLLHCFNSLSHAKEAEILFIALV